MRLRLVAAFVLVAAPLAAQQKIDKAAKKGIIKGNTADRYKSRLAAAVKRNAPAK